MMMSFPGVEHGRWSLNIPLTITKFSTGLFWWYGEKGMTVFSPVCTHLGCYVNWDNNRKEFICPCHGGRYNIDGQVIAGPPPKPLDRLPFKIEAGKVYLGVTV